MTDQLRDDQFDRLLLSFMAWQAEDLVSPPTATQVAMRIASRTGTDGRRARVASVETTPRQRTDLGRPWRMPSMPSAVAKLALSAVAVAAFVVVGLALLRPSVIGPGAAASPTASATPQPSPSAGFSRFDSPLNGLSIDYPSGWQIRPATEPWTGGAPDFDSPAADVIFDPSLLDGLYLVLASAPHTAAGSAGILDDQISLPDICPSEGDGGGAGGSQTIDGASAWVATRGCGSGGAGRHSALVATGSRGYVIYLYLGPESPQATYDEDWFAGILKTVDLRPEEAVEAPSPSPSPAPAAQPPSTFTERFDSPLNGLSISFPSGWQVRPATEPWTGEICSSTRRRPMSSSTPRSGTACTSCWPRSRSRTARETDG